MAKIAQLHNGVQIHFPDETPDDEMDRVVQHHVSQVDPNIINSFMKSVNSHAKSVLQVQSDMQKVNSEETSKKQNQEHKDAELAANDERRHDETMQGRMAQTQIIDNVGQKLGDGFAGLFPLLSKLSDNTANSSELIKAVHQLSVTVVEVARTIISVLEAPKEIYSDEKGKPKGVRTITSNRRLENGK